jgi:CheY-like chemotaxis protein
MVSQPAALIGVNRPQRGLQGVEEADDEPARPEGYDAAVAETGEEGLFLINAGSFDLVILDWMLPGRDGIEILKTLRARGTKTPGWPWRSTVRTSIRRPDPSRLAQVSGRQNPFRQQRIVRHRVQPRFALRRRPTHPRPGRRVVARRPARLLAEESQMAGTAAVDARETSRPRGDHCANAEASLNQSSVTFRRSGGV